MARKSTQASNASRCERDMHDAPVSFFANNEVPSPPFRACTTVAASFRLALPAGFSRSMDARGENHGTFPRDPPNSGAERAAPSPAPIKAGIRNNFLESSHVRARSLRFVILMERAFAPPIPDSCLQPGNSLDDPPVPDNCIIQSRLATLTVWHGVYLPISWERRQVVRTQ